GPGPISLQASTGRAAIDVRSGAHTINTLVAVDTPTTITLDGPTSALNFGPSGRLDVKGSNVVINYAASSPAGSVVAALLSGRNGGSWTGTGIVSSTAASATRHA